MCGSKNCILHMIMNKHSNQYLRLIYKKMKNIVKKSMLNVYNIVQIQVIAQFYKHLAYFFETNLFTSRIVPNQQPPLSEGEAPSQASGSRSSAHGIPSASIHHWNHERNPTVSRRADVRTVFVHRPAIGT